MLPTDMEMVFDNEFRKWSEIYAQDKDRFFKDFASAYGKLISNGVPSNKKVAQSKL
jgi:cytochrome c peroxidase